MAARARWRRLWRGARRAIGAGAVLVCAFAAWVIAVPFPTEVLAPDPVTSTVIVDRDGRPLRELLSASEGRGRWVGLDAISPHLVRATVHAEDHRFFDHLGVDGLAVLRSLAVNVGEGRAATGASTITQQTVKMTLLAGEPRTLGTKFMEAAWAMRLERALTKEEILAQYLNRAPYGHQRFGAEAASWWYFEKPAADLSLAEAALLAGIPQAPTGRNPHADLEGARRKQSQILGLMRARGAIDEGAYRRALAEPLVIAQRRSVLRARHFTDEVARRLDDERAPEAPGEPVRTTLDLVVQARVEGILAAQTGEAARHGGFQAAALVVDTHGGEVLAWVGSRGYEDAAALGANDGVLASRQPGSALKPFVYGRWLDEGGRPTEILVDRPTDFGTAEGVYRPQNYSGRFHGPVTPRVALGSSLNVPAVAVAARIGAPALLETLRAAGFDGLTRGADHYGLGLALGNGEVSLRELVEAYAALGRLGRWRPLRIGVADAPADPGRRVMSEASAFTVLSWLSDDDARAMGFGVAGPLSLPYRVAAKTGTSADFRDHWAIGVTPDYTVGIWVGRFDGRPMPRDRGRVGAAATLRQVFQALYPTAAGPEDVAWFQPPNGLGRVEVCAWTGQLATPACAGAVTVEWVTEAQRAALRPDERWVRARIDRANGLRAGPGCPDAEVIEEPRVRLLPELAAWGRARGAPLLPEAWSPRCPAQAASTPGSGPARKASVSMRSED